MCCDIYGEEGKADEPFSVFEAMWMEFPAPFHAGDLADAPTGGAWEPFVLTDISTWDLERIRQELPPTVYSEGFLFFRNKQLARCREFGCGDTMARGYTMGISSQDTIPYLYRDDFPFCNYWELEYYPKPLSGARRLLRPVSNYLKGNHDIELLVNTYSVLLQRVIWETQRSALQYVYTNEALSDAGLPEADAGK